MTIGFKERKFFNDFKNIRKLKRKCREYLSSDDYVMYTIEVYKDVDPDELDFLLVRAVRDAGSYYELSDFEYEEAGNFINKWSVIVEKDVVQKAARHYNTEIVDLLLELGLDTIQDFGHLSEFVFENEFFPENSPEEWE